jgi:4'-phosphopantetheinyl transferase
MSTFADASAAPSHAFALPCPGQVHLFSFHVESARPSLAAACTLLSADEHERMCRMRAGLARDEVILARSTLRALLGSMLLCPPRSVPLTTSVHGKPQLDPARTSAALHFSVTHSRGHILIALTPTAHLGVDIEAIDPRIEAQDIAAQNFTSAEQQLLATAPDQLRSTIFATLWVRKEAVVKAHGAGLLLPLTSFNVAPAQPDAPAEQSVRFHDAKHLHHEFFLRQLPAPAGFAAALAASQPSLQLHAHAFTTGELEHLFSGNYA